MAKKLARSQHLLLPDRPWATGVSLALLVIASTSMLVMSKTGNPAVTKARTQITDIVAPVLAVAASPMDALNDAAAWVGDLAAMHSQNIALKNENIELLKWQTLAKSMQAENESLRALLNVVPVQKKNFITARIVSDFSGPFVHSILINGGSDNGIKKDQAAISENGLVGRVVDAGASSARVLLLNDINSRVPVLAERTREKSILTGTNTNAPSLSYLSADSRIAVGDRIVTSGDGGIFPEGIPVGIVTRVQKDGVKVQPFVDAAKVNYVSVIDYSF